jgi:hypothetical protein
MLEVGAGGLGPAPTRGAGGVDDKRFAERRQMRAVVDAHFSALEKSDALDGMDSFYQRAYAMRTPTRSTAGR